MRTNRKNPPPLRSERAPEAPESQDLIRRILRGELMEIFICHVPAFRGMRAENAYDAMMSNPAIAAQCHLLFESRPDLFAHLLVDKQGNKVQDATVPLTCGRSLADITAMVVRAVAKRHFLERFKPAPIEGPQLRPHEILARMVRNLFSQQGKPVYRRKATRGDLLYRTLREHLLHAWQLPLIPHYTPLPIALIKQLGAKILDYRSTADLRRLLLEGPNAPAGEAPAAPLPSPSLPPANAPITEAKDGPSLRQSKVDAMWAIARAQGLAKIFEINEIELRAMILNVAQTSGHAIAKLSASGLKISALVVMLCTFERRFGGARMPILFGAKASPDFIDMLAEQIRVQGLADLTRAEDIKNDVEALIRSLQRDRRLPV